MRKIFTLFAAMLLTITVNAAVTAGENALSQAINDADPGDVIELNTGNFTETATFDIAKDITIKAAAGQTPVIKPKGIGIKSGANVTFVGVKIDGSVATKSVIYGNDDSVDKSLTLDSCEMYGFTNNRSAIHCGSDKKLDTCIINNCKFYNINKSVVFYEGYLELLSVTKSTFANIIPTVTNSYWAAVIHPSSATASTKVRVDQCTFYNCRVMSNSYGAVTVPTTTDVVVSNCIFALPADDSSFRAIYNAGGEVKNCLTHHYKYADNPYGIHSGPTITGCASLSNVDPLFADTANCDFSLPDNSPAHEAGVGGTHLGDPRWWPNSWKPAAIIDVTGIALDSATLHIEVNEKAHLYATVSPADATDPSVSWVSKDETVATVVGGLVTGIAAGEVKIIATAGAFSDTCTVTVTAATIPSTDFATQLFLKGSKAQLEGNIQYTLADSLTYPDTKVKGTAIWQIEAQKASFIQVTVNYKSGSSSGSKFAVVVLDDKAAKVGDTIAMTSSYDEDGNYLIPGTILLPKAGTYTIKLDNRTEWSHAKLKGITITPTKVVKFKGAWDDWAEHEATVATDGSYAAVTLNLGDFNEKEFGLTLDGDFRANGYGYHRGYTGTAGITGSSPNMKLTTDYLGDYTFKWYYANDSMAIEFPEKTLDDGFYLVGTFDGVDAWNIEDLNASKLFVWNTKVDNKDEYKLTLNLAEGDAFKVRAVSKGAFGYYYPNGTGNDYVVNNALAGNVTIYFRPEGNGGDDWHYHVIYCVRNGEPTDIDNTVVGEKAVKFFENGQIFIQKDGKVYNILGTVVK